MRKILLVEDDSFKSDDIKTLLSSVNTRLEVILAKSVSSAVSELQHNAFDLVILDMALPSHPATPGSGAPLSLLTGGLEVLFELQSLNRLDPCVVLTQYPEIEICDNFYLLEDTPTAIKDNYGIDILACLEYSESNACWRQQLINIINEYAGPNS